MYIIYLFKWEKIISREREEVNETSEQVSMFMSELAVSKRKLRWRNIEIKNKPTTTTTTSRERQLPVRTYLTQKINYFTNYNLQHIDLLCCCCYYTNYI